MDRAHALRSLCASRLCFILTRGLCRRDPLDVLRAALLGGADLIQVREKNCEAEDLLDWVQVVKRHTEAAGVALIVNDFADIALRSGAEGVHVGAADASPEIVRAMPHGERLLLGVSCHSRADVQQMDPRADYEGLGALFDTTTRLATTPCPLCDVAISSAPNQRPIFGIGGLNRDTLPLAVAAGLKRAAISSAIANAEDPAQMTRTLRNMLAPHGGADTPPSSKAP